MRDKTQTFAYISGRIYYTYGKTVRFYHMESQHIQRSNIQYSNFDKWIENKVEDKYKIEVGNLTEAIQFINLLGMECRGEDATWT